MSFFLSHTFSHHNCGFRLAPIIRIELKNRYGCLCISSCLQAMALVFCFVQLSFCGFRNTVEMQYRAQVR
jgi:hypothetical protein